MIEKPTINVVFLGGIDSGKSTLAGRLLFSLGTINHKILDRVRNSTIDQGIVCTCYANLLDRTKDEIIKGRTIHIGHNRAETKHYYLNIIDAPVAPFKKNMIRAISQANVGIIVLDGDIGAYEGGIPSLRETLVIAKSLGVPQVIFCVNKLDRNLITNPKDRFEEIKHETAIMAQKNGYLGEQFFIPISAWNDWNITEPHERLSWYKGATLIDAINNLKPPTYHSDKPLRIPILKVYNLKIGTVVFGKVESGTLTMETKLRFSNGKKKIADGTVGSIQIFNKPVTEAKAGQLITIKLENVNYQDLHAGILISDAENNTAREVVSFESEIVVMKCPNVIKQTYTPTFHFYTLQIRCKFEKLLESTKLDKSDKIENPTELMRGRYGVVLFRPERPIVVEPFGIFPPFGRFVIRDDGQLVSVGVVKKVNYADEIE